MLGWSSVVSVVVVSLPGREREETKLERRETSVFKRRTAGGEIEVTPWSRGRV